MDDQRIGILGAGGQADETQSFLAKNQSVAFKAVTREYVGDGMIDIENPPDGYKGVPVIAAIGAPKVRKDLVKTWPGNAYATVVSEKVYISKSADIGEGCLIAPGAVITTNVEIGPHSIINIGATINHDCKLGAFSTVSPGVHIAGKVQLGDGVFVGIGAVIKNDVTIADGVVVGAGAVVLKDITEENSIYAGVPAVKIGQNKDWLEKV